MHNHCSSIFAYVEKKIYMNANSTNRSKLSKMSTLSTVISYNKKHLHTKNK